MKSTSLNAVILIAILLAGCSKEPNTKETTSTTTTTVPTQASPLPATKKKFEDLTAMEVAQDPAAYGFEKGGDMIDGSLSGGGGIFGDQTWIRGVNKQWIKKTSDGKQYVLTIHYEDGKIHSARWKGF